MLWPRMGLKKIFGPKKVEVTEDWRTLYNEELRVLYSSQNSFRAIYYSGQLLFTYTILSD